MEVSWHLPSLTADRDEPLPRWQTMTRCAFSTPPISSMQRLETETVMLWWGALVLGRPAPGLAPPLLILYHLPVFKHVEGVGLYSTTVHLDGFHAEYVIFIISFSKNEPAAERSFGLTLITSSKCYAFLAFYGGGAFAPRGGSGALVPGGSGGAIVPRGGGGALVPGGSGSAIVPGGSGGALVPGGGGSALVPRGSGSAIVPGGGSGAIVPGGSSGALVLEGGGGRAFDLLLMM